MSWYTTSMQPEYTPTDWQQPNQQPSQAPYVAEPTPVMSAPIVTLQPDEPLVAEPQPVQEQRAPQPTQQLPESATEPIYWQATEYIQRDKSPLWFVLFSLVFVVIMAISIFVIRSITFDILVPVMAISLLVYAHRPARVLNYTLSHQGLHINDTLYPFAEFKSFGVIKDDDEYSVLLVPAKRFKPGVSVYFPEEVGEALVDTLGARLPMQDLSLDFVDRIIRKLRI